MKRLIILALLVMAAMGLYAKSQPQTIELPKTIRADGSYGVVRR